MTAALSHLRFRRVAAGHYRAGALELVAGHFRPDSNVLIHGAGGPVWAIYTGPTLVETFDALDDAKEYAESMAAEDALPLFDLEPAGDVTLYVIPCCAAKLDTPAPARELYTSPNFRHTLRGAEAEAAGHVRDLGTPARVVVLSALHGIVELDDVLDPYDVRMGAAGSVDAGTLRDQLHRAGARAVVTMLPSTYRDALRAATDETEVDNMDAYENTRGIGDHRAVASAMVRNNTEPADDAALFALDADAPNHPDVQAADQAAADAKEAADTAEHCALNACPQMAMVGTRRHMTAAIQAHEAAEAAANRVGTRDAYRFAAMAAGHVGRATAAYRRAAEAAGQQEFNRSAPLTEWRRWDELDALERNQWIATADANTPRWAQ